VAPPGWTPSRMLVTEPQCDPNWSQPGTPKDTPATSALGGRALAGETPGRKSHQAPFLAGVLGIHLDGSRPAAEAKVHLSHDQILPLESGENGTIQGEQAHLRSTDSGGTGIAIMDAVACRTAAGAKHEP